MAEQKPSAALTAPLRGAASVLRRVPGAELVTRAADETLDKVGAVSPRGRRIAVYAGAGLLGAAGVVEWPVALTGAAVAWLTQPRPAHPDDSEDATAHRPEPAHDLGTATLRSGHRADGAEGTGGAASAGAGAPGSGATGDTWAADGAQEAASRRASRRVRKHSVTRASGRARGSGAGRTARDAEGSATERSATEGSAVKPSSTRTGPLGPTARPGRTVI
ncbi:hypothetical protein AB0L75_10610 [Streptomyces sp. NPDC052101]|uniref:hypothetical protein n=1 Tax=Streptomyces sp. NPDC052101 TaxID=3155763 RepID=UPI0034461C10